MMHVEALRWPSCIFAGNLRANCHELCELGSARKHVAGGRPDAARPGPERGHSPME